MADCNRMTKAELIAQIAEGSQLTICQAERALSAFIGVLEYNWTLDISTPFPLAVAGVGFAL